MDITVTEEEVKALLQLLRVASTYVPSRCLDIESLESLAEKIMGEVNE